MLETEAIYPSRNRRPSIGKWCGCAVAASLLIASIAVAAVQFYKPNREARLVVALKNRDRYASRPVIVTVMLSNQALESLLINKRMRLNRYPLDGEVAFVIEGPGGKPYPLVKVVSPHDVRSEDLAVLKVGETMEEQVDLTDLYAVRKKGTYRIQAIYYNNRDLEKNGLRTWRGTLASEPVEIRLD